MTTTTDVDARGKMAAAELRATVENLRVPDTLINEAPRKRRVALAFTALLLVGAVVVAVAARDEGSTTLITGTPTALPLLVPTYLPDGTLYRIDGAMPQGSRVTTTAFASTERQVRGRTELLVSVRSLESGFDSEVDEGIEVSVRGHLGRSQEYAIDNGETLRCLVWLEDANTQVSVYSTTLNNEALVAAVEELQFADGGVTNQDVGGLSLLLRNSSTDLRDTRTLTLRSQSGRFLSISIARATPAGIGDWLPGREVDVRGHKAWLSHQPTTDTNLAASISWSPSPGVIVFLASSFPDDEVLRVARSLREVSQSEWDALPTS